MFVAICVFILAFIAWQATSRERVFLASLFAYMFLTAGLLTGCIEARRAGIAVAPMDSAHRVGLRAEDILAPTPPPSHVDPVPVPVNRQQRKQLFKHQLAAKKRQDKFIQRYLLNSQQSAAAPGPRKVKVVDKSTTTTKHKDQSTTKEQGKQKWYTVPPKGAGVFPPVKLRQVPPPTLGQRIMSKVYLVVGLGVLGAALLSWLWYQLKTGAPLRWLGSFFLALFKRRRDA